MRSFTQLKLTGRELGSAQGPDCVFYNSCRDGILGWKPRSVAFLLSRALVLPSRQGAHLSSHLQEAQTSALLLLFDQRGRLSTLRVSRELTKFQSEAKTPAVLVLLGDLVKGNNVIILLLLG